LGPISTPKSKIINSKNLKKRKLSNIDSNSHPIGKNARTYEVREADLKDFKYLEGTIHRDDDDLQRYITDKVYIDKRLGYIVGVRTLLLKDGQKHIVYDPSPIHVRSLVKMTKAYEDESSPREHRAMISSLLTLGAKINESTNKKSNLGPEVNGLNNGRFGEIFEDEGNNVEDFSKLIAFRMKGDKLVDYCLQTSLFFTGILTPTTRKEAMSSPQRALV